MKGDRHMNLQQYDQFRAQLLEQKRDLMGHLNENDHFDTSHGMKDAGSVGELSLYDNHPADIGTELYEREKDIALNEHLEQEMKEVDAALERLENGTYGICVACGQPIAFERLQAVPTAKYCVRHQPNDQVSERRPVEEEVLESFGNFEYDHRDDETEFDSEDAWQQVARYNELAMTYELTNMDDEDEPIGYVEPIEAFAATDIEGYTGYDQIRLIRNTHYDKYFESEAGAGIIYAENDENDMFG